MTDTPDVPGIPGPDNADNEDWWPGWPDVERMYKHPAFQVQRNILSYTEGGDWVRGSVPQYQGTLSGAGTALPLTPPLNSLWLLGTPVPTAAPSPPAPLVKAAGQAIFWNGTDWVNLGVLVAPVQTAIRYPIGSETVAEAAAQRGILYTRVFDYNTIEIFWGIPGRVFDTWAEVAIVRSAFGYPDTVNDGQTIYRKTKTELFPEGVPDNFSFQPIYDLNKPSGSKAHLNGGRYYYYSLFFRVNFQWARSMTAASLLPRDHHHADHLWNSLPPYYQWTDAQQGADVGEDGHLRKFLRVFGFELDTIREFVEQWQELYHIDFCPSPLLRRLGPTFGVPYESGGIGDIRYRSLLAEIGRLYQIRGTRPCLELVCESVSKYECDVTQTGNLMTLPDDSDFFEGVGNWAGHNKALPSTTIIPGVTVLDPNKVFFKSNTAIPPKVGFGRGVMEVWTSEADELTDALITCGCGISYDVYTGRDEELNVDYPYDARYIYPIQVGILCDVDGVYSFSVQVKMETPYPIDVMILWFDTNGVATSASYKGRTLAASVAPPNTDWKAYSCTGTVPVGAVYAVPAIQLDRSGTSGGTTTGDKSPAVYFCGAAVYNLGSSKRISSEAPNPYLQMGNRMERMGEPIAVPPAPDAVPGYPPLPAPYPGYPIGKQGA